MDLLGALARQQIELGDPASFLGRRDERGPLIELVDDVEDPFLELAGWPAFEEQSPQVQVHRRPLALRDERVRRLLHAIVREAIFVLHLQQQIVLERRTQRALRRAPGDAGERVGVHAGAQASSQLEELLRLGRKGVQLAHHQVDDVVRVSLRPDARELPPPAARRPVEEDQSLPVQRGQELDDEERVSARLFAHQVCERFCLRARAVDGVSNELADIGLGQRPEDEVSDRRPFRADLVERAPQRMRGADLAVPVSAHEEQVADARVDHEVHDQSQAGGVSPLQVIEEDDQRTLFARERAEELAQERGAVGSRPRSATAPAPSAVGR